MRYTRHIGLRLAILLLFGLSQSHAKIVFHSKRNEDTDYHIYVMEDNGSNVRRVTSPDFYDYYARWFPDGQRILFVRDWAQDAGHINTEFYIIDADGRNEHRFTENHPTDYFPALSPDGETVAFMSSRRDRNGLSADIYTYHLESRQLKRLTDNLKSGARSRRTDWSPDGRKIAYEHESKEDGDNVWIMGVHGGGKHRLSLLGPGELFDARGGPRWSPSGKYIMYTEHIWRVNKGDFRRVTTRVIIQEVRTGIQRFHHFSNKDTIADGCWMGNDQTVLLPIIKEWDAPGANYEIYRYDLVSRQLTNLTNQPGDDVGPHWISGSLAVSPAGKLTILWGQLKQVD